MNESNTKKTLKGMSSQTIVTIVLGVFEIVSFSIMSRLLSQTDFGYYAALSAITVVFSAISDAGIGSALVQRKNLDQDYINNAFTLCLIFGGFSCLVLYLCSGFLATSFIDNSMTTPLRIMSLGLFCGSFSSAYISILHRELKFFTIGLINLISIVITTIFAIVLAYLGYGYYAIIVKSVLSSIIILILSALISKTRFRLAWNNNIIKSIWGFSGWLMASSIFRNFASQIDRLLMTKLLSVDLLGMYNRPKEFISQISGKFNNIFDTALFPVLSGIQDDYAKMRAAYLRSLYYLNIFSVVLSIAFFVNAELIVRIFFGQQWLNTVSTFQILSLALIFQTDARLADCYLRSLGWTKQQFWFRIVEVLLQIIGMIIGSYFGINGVALSVVIVNIICILLKNLFITHNLRIKFKESVWTIIRSWKIALIMLPIFGLELCFLPHNMNGNLVIALSFFLIVMLSFLLFPLLVGTQYANDAYQQIMVFIRNKINNER